MVSRNGPKYLGHLSDTWQSRCCRFHRGSCLELRRQCRALWPASRLINFKHDVCSSDLKWPWRLLPAIELIFSAKATNWRAPCVIWSRLMPRLPTCMWRPEIHEYSSNRIESNPPSTQPEYIRFSYVLFNPERSFYTMYSPIPYHVRRSHLFNWRSEKKRDFMTLRDFTFSPRFATNFRWENVQQKCRDITQSKIVFIQFHKLSDMRPFWFQNKLNLKNKFSLSIARYILKIFYLYRINKIYS